MLNILKINGQYIKQMFCKNNNLSVFLNISVRCVVKRILIRTLFKSAARLFPLPLLNQTRANTIDCLISCFSNNKN